MFRTILPAALITGFLAGAAQAQTVYVDQGRDWTPTLRDQFYTQDQGARIMPLSWMQALRTAEGAPFLGDDLARYGYLPMPGREDAPLPVGFTTNNYGGETAIGMTCSACHTREISVNGTAYRIDGGPGIVDFQNFLRDLDNAVLHILSDEDAFMEFAEAVLGDEMERPAIAALHARVEVWSNRFHTLIDKSLPDPAWGPARLDAVSMIFNRLAGLDIGDPEDDYIIAENIEPADAPTRYPFLWNAARQDKTQWPGFADNGNALLGLSRNLGEVYGVFGEFHPVREDSLAFTHDFISENSANWDGLKALEDWIWDIGAPRWPWGLNTALARQGEAIFNRDTEDGGCTECHGKRRGAFRSISHTTYATPIKDVGTDIRECQILTRTVKTGVLEGAKIPIVGKPLGAEATAFEALGVSVIGAILQHASPFRSSGPSLEGALSEEEALKQQQDFLQNFDDLKGAFPIDETGAGPMLESAMGGGCAYEARVLDGIWAAAPYLHNGTVPTLVELLTPPEERVESFVPGPNYDIENVGMAVEQTAFDHVIETTGCDVIDSGNSRCGHAYGTDLSDAEKEALLEYLKSI